MRIEPSDERGENPGGQVFARLLSSCDFEIDSDVKFIPQISTEDKLGIAVALLKRNGNYRALGADGIEYSRASEIFEDGSTNCSKEASFCDWEEYEGLLRFVNVRCELTYKPGQVSSGSFVLRAEDESGEISHLTVRFSMLPGAGHVFGATLLHMRFLRLEASVFKLKEVVSWEIHRSRLRKGLSIQNGQGGLILIGGATGSGKTTTANSLLNEALTVRSAFHGEAIPSIFSIEDPVEYQNPLISQVEVGINVDAEGRRLDFGQTFQSVLRYDPDIVFLGEIRSYEALHLAVEAASSGHLVVSTVHSRPNREGIRQRISSLGGDWELFKKILNMTVGQSLLPKLCPECREETRISDSLREELVDLGFLKEDATFYRAPPLTSNCELCKGTGVRGKVAVMEVISLRPDDSRVDEEVTSMRDFALGALASGFIGPKLLESFIK